MNNKNPEKLVRGLIEFIGEDPEREGLRDTPRRVIKSYEKLFSGYKQKPEDVLTVFGDELYDEMIVVKDIEFFSFCEHHFLPFYGKAHVGYIPDGKIIGLSKIPRLVEMFARRLQNQERMTSQIAQGLYDVLKPKGVGVIVEAEHLCMMARGVEKQHSFVTTSALRGLFKKELNTRNEFLRLVGR
ncbi:GTP cyclohydrolase I FolE [Patescibacteria group bacterium]|nr:GTP cyclohydrolase I FolE [Patescibacteria group bacterium]MBU1703234.1 GTP cyclohydrolase I FolE [Patescibacteria group bacterium]MBU1953838.1 GTP cyclohydrolase I FolE [Patescibacteria group bacterium]